MSLRRKKWEKWKRREIETCPPKERHAFRKLLDSMPMPTPEEERRMEKIKRMVEAAFGKGKPTKRRKGKRRGKG